MKKILCLLLVCTLARADMPNFFFNAPGGSGAVLPVTSTWIGANNGTWNTASNWSPANIPNANDATANMYNSTGSVKTVSLNTNVILNKLNFVSSSAGLTIAPAASQTITLAGATPSIDSSLGTGVATASADLILSSDTNITGANDLVLTGAKTYNSHSIFNTHTGIVRIGGGVGATGGTFYHRGKYLQTASTNFGGTVTLNWRNSLSGTSFEYFSGGQMGGPIVLDDTGSFDFNFGNGADIWIVNASISGAVTHNLRFNATGGVVSPTSMASLTNGGSSRFIFEPTTGGTNCSFTTAIPSGFDIDIGDGAAGGLGGGGATFTATYTTVPNTIRVKPRQAASPGDYVLKIPQTSTTVSGGIILNSDANAASGSTFSITNTGNFATTVSGVISNGASGAANITMQFIGATAGNSTTLSNTNTYTSPTKVNGANALLNVTGSISSSAVTIAGNSATLKGNGTVGAVTVASGTSPKLEAKQLTGPAVTDVLTISGNLTESVSTIHNFQSNTTGGSSRFQINGNLTANGTVTLSTATSGQTYTIANYTGTSSGVWTSSQGTITDNTGTKTITIAVP
jgi:hypothetical protein